MIFQKYYEPMFIFILFLLIVFNFEIFPSDIYFLDKLPSEINIIHYTLLRYSTICIFQAAQARVCYQ